MSWFALCVIGRFFQCAQKRRDDCLQAIIPEKRSDKKPECVALFRNPHDVESCLGIKRKADFGK